MDPPRWPQINALLDAVLALPPAERRAYLDAHSPDPAVRREVESLLAAHDEAGSFLDAPAGTYAAGLLEDPPDPLVGQEIDGYRLLRVLGRGGMGVVYEAEDLALGRHVALKMIVPALARDASFVRRFQDEARTLARIESPHIVQVHALRRTDAGLFIVMEYVDGGTVKDRMEAGPMPWAQARPLVLQMLTALEHAHGVGVIHRDIKPGNLLLTRSGTVKVTDFGLAKVYEGEDAATLTQGIAGTLNYMAPEQVLGRRDLGPPADLYALGLTIYHLLAGRLPFDAGGGEYAVMQSIVESDFPPPSQFEPGLPPALDGVLARALARAPEDRFANAAAMRAAFAAVPAEQAAPVPGERTALLQRTDAPPPPADAPPRRRSRLLYGAAAVAATAVLALAGVWLLPISTAPEDGTLQPPLAAADSGAADPARPRDDFVPAGSQPPVQEAEGTPAANEEIDDPAPTEAAGTGTDDPAEPTPVATGTLLLHVAPGGGSIRIDGAPECRSDAPCAVPAGQRSVTFSHPRYGDHQTRLRVTAGGTTERTFQFEQSVNVQAVGGFASVWIRPAGGTWRTQPDWFTPKTLTLGPGTWEIEVRKQGDEVGGGPRTVVVEPGFDLGPQRVVFQLQPP